ncbi:MAG: hypothetical protein GY788_22450, partial [bacterium]|nr:hypothetical protein [bacterium]
MDLWWVPVTQNRIDKEVCLSQSLLDEVAERAKGTPELQNLVQHTFLFGAVPKTTATMMAELVMSSVNLVSIPENDPLIIPAFRHIQAPGSDYLSGGGFARHLAKFHHPVLSDRDTYQPLWDSFVSFVRTVMTDPDASVDIGGYGEEVLVTLSG